MKSHDRLEQLYKEIKEVILFRQHPVSGLLPASTAVNSHGNYTDAWVRDNVYSIMGPWALSMAFRHRGDTTRQDELEQATIKLMRGLLLSMMRQADKVENFKHTLAPLDSLHAKYATASGLTVVADDAWGHLQIDATSLYLLMLAQITASGLRIIQTYDEVDFIQNLIYYISAAYRTPDYGIWERGNKINNGNPEINVSSVGMAKAALQALDGFNLFGPNATDRAIVHTVADSVSLARTSLGALLPRESLSKEVDSALLSVIGFPAFAIGDPELNTKTRDAILKKLGGRYGCKRFLWDGHQTSIEDPHRLYYEHSELANFEHIESEWPLFFCYLYLSSLMEGDESTARDYRQKIESVMVEVDGTRLIPELYYLLPESVAAEKHDPGSQDRIPNENVPLVWAQSLYYTALLVDEGLIEADELDSIGLRTRTTSFNQAQIALVVVAENEHVKQQLAEAGVIAESIEDIKPFKVISAPHLVEAYAQVGANHALGLSGRTRRRLQSLASSQTYDINNQKCLCLSWIQSENDDYRMRNAELVSARLKREVAHIRKHWLSSEVAVFTFMVTPELCQAPTIKTLFDTLKNIQLRTIDANVGYASASLAYRASRENRLFVPRICLHTIQARSMNASEKSALPESAATLLNSLRGTQQAAYKSIAAYLNDNPLEEEATETPSNHGPVAQIYEESQRQGQWLIARLAFSTLNKRHMGLADDLSVLSARHFSVMVGSKTNTEFSLDPTLNDEQIVETLNGVASGPIEHCLLQETLAVIGNLQRTDPNLFEGLRSIHLHNLLKLCSKDSSDEWNPEAVLAVGMLSPFELSTQIRKTLDSQHSTFTSVLKGEFAARDITEQFQSAAISMDWFEWRVERGMVVNLDRRFLESVWQSFSHANTIIFGDAGSQECVIDCALVRQSMTSGEEIFAKLIDDSIQTLHTAYYKSAIKEALWAYAHFCENHPSVRFEVPLYLGGQIENAARLFCFREHQHAASSRDIDLFLQESPEVLQFYIEKALLETAEKEMETVVA